MALIHLHHSQENRSLDNDDSAMFPADMEVYDYGNIEENKLSTVAEVSELTDTPTPPTQNRSACRDASISGSVQVFIFPLFFFFFYSLIKIFKI